MKIQEIRVLPLFGANAASDREQAEGENVYTLVELITDEGVTGLGSVYTSAQLVKGALAVLRPRLIGASAVDPARVAETLHQSTFWQGRGGAITHAISGVDIALWDLFGKITGQPISRLLGGRHRERIKPYGSLIMTEPERMAERLQPGLERGFKAFKIGWGPFGRRDDVKLDEAIVKAARQGIGDDAELFVDAGGSDAYWPQGLKWAIRTAHMLADYNVGWFEEALRPDALDDHCELRRQSPVPIAGGEVLTRRQTYLPWFVKGAFDIVQPDATKVGGISEQRRIAWMADEFGIKYVGHGWNTALGVAADLQIAAAMPHTDLVEFIGGSPYVDGLLAQPFALDEEGYIGIPDSPGLGVTLDRNKIARYSPSADKLFER
jgi:D-galactarolactone cycloisomerase